MCKRPTSGYILTNNYVARSTRQGSSGCFRFAKYHSFQTLNAYLLDDLYNGSVPSFHWEKYEKDRSFRLSLAPQFQCSPGSSAQDWLNKVGLPEYCISRYHPIGNDYSSFPPPAKECELCDTFTQEHLGGDSWPDDCSNYQKSFDNVIIYRSGPMNTLFCSGSLEDKKQCLAQAILDHGPLAIHMLAGHGQDLGTITDDAVGYEISSTVDTHEVTCFDTDPDGDTTEGHVMSLVGYNFLDPAHSYFYLQNSHGSEKVVLRIEFDDNWNTTCEFASGEIVYFEGVSGPTVYNDSGDNLSYQNYCEGDDLNLNGIPDDEDIDIDGDSIVNDWDSHPLNYFLGTDLDEDGHPDNQYRGSSVSINFGKMCEPACHTLFTRKNGIFDIQECLNFCRDTDGCMTLKIKNGGDDPTDPEQPCYWSCARKNYCDQEEGCCEDPEIAQNQNACKETYRNLSNKDANDDGVADVCSYYPVASDIQFPGFATQTVIVQPQARLRPLERPTSGGRWWRRGTRGHLGLPPKGQPVEQGGRYRAFHPQRV